MTLCKRHHFKLWYRSVLAFYVGLRHIFMKQTSYLVLLTAQEGPRISNLAFNYTFSSAAAEVSLSLIFNFFTATRLRPSKHYLGRWSGNYLK